MLMLNACSKKDEAQVSTPVPVAAPEPVKPENPLEEEVEERPVYVYSGDRFRDPFAEVGQTTAYQPNAIFSPEQAKLKAVIFSPRLRSAVIQVAGSGSYFIKGSRIFDVMGKDITEYKAKVYLDKVIITGEAEDEYTLKIRDTEEEEEKS